MANKSLLENLTIADKAFPLAEKANKTFTTPTDLGPVLGIVSTCPTCGAPIYGRKFAFNDEPVPTVRYSCDCKQDRKTLLERMQTK